NPPPWKTEGLAVKATISWTGALVVCALAASVAPASDYWYPASRPHFPTAPDACGPGYYSTSAGGMVYGPNYWVQPAFPPFTMNPPPATGGGREVKPWPVNPYIRGPRDFFMW